jgi:hypothetical protein
MRFFNSKNVKIFPCSNRGNYSSTAAAEASGTLDNVFDLESRLASEYNFTHLPGAINKLQNKKSYIISWEQLPYSNAGSKDPNHAHSYNDKGVCACGALRANHEHNFNANDRCLDCGWTPDYLLKLVLNGYYFEIITKRYPIFTVLNGPVYGHVNQDLLRCKLWITLQKNVLRQEDLYDNTRSTYQLGSMFARSYLDSYEAKAANPSGTTNNNITKRYYIAQTREVLAGSTIPEIPVSTIPASSIALNFLDFPATTEETEVKTKEYYCAAIGITSPGSLEPWVGTTADEEAPPRHFKVRLERETGETESDVELYCLDLSDPANWLDNLAAGEFLYSPDFENRVDGPDNLAVKNIYVSKIAPTQTKSGTITENATLNIEATSITAGDIIASTVTTGAHRTGKLTAGDAKITLLSACPTANITDLTVSTVNLPAMSRVTLTGEPEESNPITLLNKVQSMIDEADDSVKNDLRGNLVLRAADTENGVSEIKLASDINFTKLYGNTPCIAQAKENWSSADADAWQSDIPTGLTLTGLRQEISCLTQKGGEPNNLNYLYIGDKQLDTTSKGDDTLVVDLDQKLAITNLSDASRVSDLETLVGTSEFYADTTIVEDIANLKVQLKNLDNVMNFVDVILPAQLRTYTQATVYADKENRAIEVGDVVIVSDGTDGGEFEYLGKTYKSGTEFICTKVPETPETWTSSVPEGETPEEIILKSIWQEIGTCNITTSAINNILGEDTREGSIKGRLCAVEDGIDDINKAIGIGDYSETDDTILKRIKAIEDDLGEEADEGATGDSTIKGRLGSLETIVGEYESEDSIGDRLSSLEDLTSATGEIRTAISGIVEDIGDTDADGTVINRLGKIETAIGSSGTTESILDRLATIEGILDGTGDTGDSGEGEVDSSITGRLTAVDSRLTAVETNIGNVAISNVVERISTLEDNEIVKAAANLTLDDFKTSIEDAVIEDEDFIRKVEGFIGTTVDGQAEGKVIDFIETFAETDDFKTEVRTEIESEITTFASTSEFTDAVDSQVDSRIASYVESDDFKDKVDTEIVSNYVLDSEAAIEAIYAQASAQAQLYPLSTEDENAIKAKASAVAQSYTLTGDDEGAVNTKVQTKVQATIDAVLEGYSIPETTFEEKLEPKVKTKLATYISDTYDLTADDKKAVETKVVTYISNDYVFDTDEQIQSIIDGKATTAVNNAITAYTIAADNDKISGKVTEAYNTKIDQYTITSTDATITAKVNSAFYTAVQNMKIDMKIVALAFNSNEVPVDPALIQPVVAVSGSSITLPTLTSNGKIFRGWHPNKDSTEAYFVVYAPQENTLYYAIWEEAPETED